MSKTAIIVYDKPEEFRAYLEERFPEVHFCYADRPSEVQSTIDRYQPEIAFSIKHHGMPDPAHVPLPKAPSIKWIQVGGSGVDHISPWDQQRVTVTNSAGVLARFLAETVTGAMIAVNSDLFTYRAQQREKVWAIHPFRPLVGQTLMVVGLGRIGQWVAKNAKALGMNVIGVNRSPKPDVVLDKFYPLSELQDVIHMADIVTLHVSLNPQTNRLIDRGMLYAMKRGAMLMNTSRGKVIDEAALIDVLKDGHLRAAYLDVFEQEPLPISSPLWELPNVFMTPHSADIVENFPYRFAEFFAENLDRYLAGKKLKNVVYP